MVTQHEIWIAAAGIHFTVNLLVYLLSKPWYEVTIESLSAVIQTIQIAKKLTVTLDTNQIATAPAILENAIQLLQTVGFPAEIVAQARENVIS